ncbi:helix-turn-helix domain-containing protein [Deinococcus navajonensis]|uniref:Helix-turn-helix domain-containing protein n=1 Tax=Deinococcus navajonensis TaxID=309884 RepID=A0ABV8XL44_9DEIO
MTEALTYAHVGEAIKARRMALGLTQEDLCERLGWDKRRISDVSQIETGSRANLTIDRLRTFARALNFSVSDLVHGLSAESEGPTNNARQSVRQPVQQAG